MSVPNFSSATWTHKPTQSTESSSPQISYIVTLCCGSAFPKFWSLKWLLVAMLTFRFRTLDTNSTRSISSWVKVLNAKFLLGEAFFLPGGRNVQPRRVGGVCTCQESYSGWMIPLTLLVCVDRVLRELGSPERSWLQHWSSQRTGKWPNMACQLFLLIKFYWNSQAHSFADSLWLLSCSKGRVESLQQRLNGLQSWKYRLCGLLQKGLPIPCSHQFGHSILEHWVCWRGNKPPYFSSHPLLRALQPLHGQAVTSLPLTLYDRSFPLLGLMIPLPFSSAWIIQMSGKWKIRGSESGSVNNFDLKHAKFLNLSSFEKKKTKLI